MNSTSLVAFLHNVKKAKEFAEDFNRAIKKPILKNYINRLDYILNDFKSSILFPDDVRNAVRDEIESDVLVVDAIVDRIRLLNPPQREVIELIMDKIIAGEEILFVDSEQAKS